MQKMKFSEFYKNRKKLSISGVYVFEFFENVFKIGQSANIYKRIISHNSNRKNFGCGNIDTVWFIHVEKFPVKAESQIHKILNEYRLSNREHFLCPIEKIIEASKKLTFLNKNYEDGPKFNYLHTKVFSARTGAEMTQSQSAIFNFCENKTQPLYKVIKILRLEIAKTTLNRANS